MISTRRCPSVSEGSLSVRNVLKMFVCTEFQINVIVCRGCGTTLCNMSNMINVSAEGNSALYVNPGHLF